MKKSFVTQDLKLATQLLQKGEVVGMPTETVYGLAAAISNSTGVNKIFSVKNRPFFDPLIVHVSSVAMAKALTTDWSPIAEALAKHFWPGPLTLVLKKSNQVSDLITSGLESVGIRMPNHPMALELIQQVQVPLAAPSANKFGRTSPTTAIHVLAEFSDDGVLILDGGPSDVGIESTVLKINSDQLSILRPGHVQKKQIEACLQNQGLKFTFINPIKKGEAPGQMQHHYMPAVPLILLTQVLSKEQLRQQIQNRASQIPETIDGVKILRPNANGQSIELRLSSDPTLAAREFYAKLRECAQGPADLIVFQQQDLHQTPDWAALMDRLTKAASLVI